MSRQTPIRARDLDLESSDIAEGPTRRNRDIAKHREGSVNPNAMTPAEMMARDDGRRRDSIPEEFDVRTGSSGRKVVSKQPYQPRGSALTGTGGSIGGTGDTGGAGDQNRRSSASSQRRSYERSSREDKRPGKVLTIAVAAVIVLAMVLVFVFSR